MKTEAFVRLWAGLLTLASLALAHLPQPSLAVVHRICRLHALSVGLTGFCPASWLYEKATGRGAPAAPATQV